MLPSSVYVEEHLPGAINVPLETLDDTSQRLDDTLEHGVQPKRASVMY